MLEGSNFVHVFGRIWFLVDSIFKTLIFLFFLQLLPRPSSYNGISFLQYFCTKNIMLCLNWNLNFDKMWAPALGIVWCTYEGIFNISSSKMRTTNPYAFLVLHSLWHSISFCLIIKTTAKLDDNLILSSHKEELIFFFHSKFFLCQSLLDICQAQLWIPEKSHKNGLPPMYQFSPLIILLKNIWGEFKWDTYENKDNGMRMVRLQIKRSKITTLPLFWIMLFYFSFQLTSWFYPTKYQFTQL